MGLFSFQGLLKYFPNHSESLGDTPGRRGPYPWEASLTEVNTLEPSLCTWTQGTSPSSIFVEVAPQPWCLHAALPHSLVTVLQSPLAYISNISHLHTFSLLPIAPRQLYRRAYRFPSPSLLICPSVFFLSLLLWQSHSTRAHLHGLLNTPPAHLPYSSASTFPISTGHVIRVPVYKNLSQSTCPTRPATFSIFLFFIELS